MQREAKSLLTKKALAEALKKRMETSAISQITIGDLVMDCNLNRNTFYYHFEDIYALLKWMLEEEAIQVVKHFNLLVDYEDALQFIIQYVNANKHILNCTIDSMGREQLKLFFAADFRSIVENLIVSAEEDLKVRVPKDYTEFLTFLYTETIACMLIEWIKAKDTINVKTLMAYLTETVQISLTSVLKAKGVPIPADQPEERKQRNTADGTNEFGSSETGVLAATYIS